MRDLLRVALVRRESGRSRFVLKLPLQCQGQRDWNVACMVVPSSKKCWHISYEDPKQGAGLTVYQG